MDRNGRAASQCTIGSGCESGWTLYLDQSTTTLYQDHHFHGDYRPTGSLKHTQLDPEEEEEEEEGLSMVSDASSGPPNYHQDYDQDSFYGNGYHQFSGSASDLAQTSKIKKKKKSKSTDPKLDDTASSPVLTFSKRNMSFSNKKQPSMEQHVSSQGFSATHYKGKSTVKKHFGFFKSEKGQ